MANLIYKVLRPLEWATLTANGETDGSPADQADGFIHFSTAAQLPGTLGRHYGDADDLLLAALDADGLGQNLRWEPARDGSLFPHLYGPLRLTDILRHWPLSRGPDGNFVIPDLNESDA